MKLRLLVILVVCSVALSSALRAETILSGTAAGLDEDSIALQGQRVRLWGIDAPAVEQTCKRGGKPWTCGRDAARALSHLVTGKTVRCLVIVEDKLRRLIVGDCTLGGESLSRWMVRNGWAVMNPRQTDAYAKEQAEAKEANRGIWSSEFEMPWDWRIRQRMKGKQP
ncbi:thermonuclease family protein [Vineibacter terrae]|uniref:thermonuclease family protein n=1 Tax=Vineibacter terrae TaxID=2586908 RepID=UPI002E36DA38|nr:thermonuclease family protein [Vineibacter terrae]HEX2884896.1 thermonuclease family protein [Vineibacter terrae]